MLGFEHLEDRNLLAVFLVKNTSDVANGNAVFGSLRWAINSANADDTRDTIIFDENIFVTGTGQSSIFLNGGQLNISQPVDIIGPGARQLAVVQGQANRRVFNIAIGSDDEIFGVQISGMTISGGNLTGTAETQRGGGIYNREALTMIETIIENNSATRGGGGVYSQRGGLNLQRSLVQNNSANVGGGIMNGGSADDDRATTNIQNSTITGNSAFGGGTNYDNAYGGGLFNRNGTMNIFNSTVAYNYADGGLGEGVASWGNGFPEDLTAMPIEIPAPNVFTNVGSSIIWGNGASDIDKVGKTDDDPPEDLLASITSLGFNFVGTGNATVPGMPRFMGEPDTQAFFMPADNIGVDPLLLGLDNYGGSTDVFLLDPTSPAIDAGELFAFDQHEQRGRHFVREFDYDNDGDAIADVGAVELQRGIFVVDHLKDELDSQFSKIYTIDTSFGIPFFDVFDPYNSDGDFSLREAIEFARLNPEFDVIRFSDSLLDVEPPSAVINPPTIRLTGGTLNITESLVIEGPTTFILEVDASGSDPTPDLNEGNGRRVFNIDDGDLSSFADVSISNLTIMGADVNDVGGGIYNRENLTLSGVTVKNNAANRGGGLFVQTGTVTIHASTFNDNEADDDGGAIFIDSFPANGPSEVTITNSTFSSNDATDRGGAIVNDDAQLLIRHSTVTLNTAGFILGGGIYNATNAALTEIFSSIVSANVNGDVDVLPGVNQTTIVSLGYNLVGKGNSVTANRFNQTGDQANVNNPLLAPLINTGGLVATHRPLTGSLAIDRGAVTVSDPFIVTPIAVTSSTTGDSQSADFLIDNSGLSSAPTLDDYLTVTHAAANATNSWLTADPGAPGGDYFVQSQDPPPSLLFEFDAMYVFSGMLIWGYNDPANLEHNPRDLIVEFSVDGGQTFYDAVDATHLQSADLPDNISFGAAFAANAVRVTITDNYFRPPAAGGGNRVGMGEVKFINPFDQRGADFARVFDGDLNGTPRMDVGAYELQSSVITVSTAADESDGNYTSGDLSLREAILIANDNPLPDTIIWADNIVGVDIVHFLNGGPSGPTVPADMRITADVTITGPGSELLTLDLSGNFDSVTGTGRRAFTIDDSLANHNLNVVITGLTFRGSASAQTGGAILTRENLTLQGVTFSQNHTVGDGFHGGALFAEKPAGGPAVSDITVHITSDDRDPLNVISSRITGNGTNGVNADGGAIYARDVRLVIDGDVNISGNTTLKTQSDGAAIYVKSTFNAPPPADFNNDAKVDAFDFLTWQQNFGRIPATKAQGDANNNAAVTGSDFAIWGSQFGTIGTQGGSLSATQITVTGNQTSGGDSDGGGIFIDGALLDLIDSSVSGNATVGSNSEGGGLVVKNGNATLERTVVSLNATIGSTSPGAGVFVISTGGGATSNLTATNSVIQRNTTAGQGSHGAGVAVQGGAVTLRSSVVSLNKTTGLATHGGGLANLGGNLSIVDSTVAANEAASSTSVGGGVYSDTNLANQTTFILNSTVSGNTAPFRGGGVFNADGLTEIKHSTITNNATSFANLGAGVASVGNAATLTRVQSSIVAGNVGSAAGTQTDIDFVDGALVNSIQSLGFNLIGTGNSLAAFTAGNGDQKGVLNPGLAPLADNGGPNVFLNPETHALLVGSPAKNAGNPNFDPNSFSQPLVFDQRGTGFARVQLGRIDIGSFESNVFPVEAALEAASAPAGSAALTAAPNLTTAESTSSAPTVLGLHSLSGLGLPLSRGDGRLDAGALRALDRDRHVREPGALLVRHHLVFDRWATSSLDDQALTETSHSRGRRSEASEGDDLSAGDAVFSLLGDDFLS